MMKRTILALLVLVVLVLGGCKGGVTGGTIVCNKPYILVGTDCCLDKDDNSVCDKDEIEEQAVEPVEPPKEEVEEEPAIEEVETPPETVEEPEEVASNEFLIGLGDSIEFDKKTITLVALENIPRLKAIFDVDGIERDIYGTKSLEIINNIEVTIMKYLNLENSIIVKLEKFELGDNEYMITPRKDIPIKNMKVHLEDVQDEGKILINVLGTDLEDSKLIIKEGETKTFAGLKITNIDGFPRGFKIEEYAIIKIEL